MWTLLQKDIRLLLRSRGELALTFVVPILMATVFGFVFSSGNDVAEPIRVLYLDQDHSPFSQRLQYEFRKESAIKLVDSVKEGNAKVLIDSVIATNRITRGKNSIALVVPQHAFDTLVQKGKIALEVWNDPKAAIETNILGGMIQKTVFSGMPELLGLMMIGQTSQSVGKPEALQFDQGLRELVSKTYHMQLDTLNKHWMKTNDSASIAQQLLRPLLDTAKTGSKGNSGQGMNPFGNMFLFQVRELVGEKVVNPGVSQSIAGTAVLFLIFTVGSIAQTLLKEKREGTLRRLLLSGITVQTLLFEKWLFHLILGMLQLYAMFGFGKLVFGLELGYDPLQLLLISVLTVLAVTGVGLLVAAIAKSEEMASMLVTIIALSMSSIGGSMFPSFLMPGWLQTIGKFTLNHWAMLAYQNYFWRRLPLSESLTSLLVLGGICVVVTVVTIPLLQRKYANE
ncbi:MAG: ABC transporter permease [bacterium]|nr:ABC transporter permease [bacterium]